MDLMQTSIMGSRHLEPSTCWSTTHGVAYLLQERRELRPDLLLQLSGAIAAAVRDSDWDRGHPGQASGQTIVASTAKRQELHGWCIRCERNRKCKYKYEYKCKCR